MIKAYLKRFILDYLVFIKNHDINKVIIIIVYINNIFFFEPNIMEINIIKSFLANKYKIKDLSFYNQFIDIKLK